MIFRHLSKEESLWHARCNERKVMAAISKVSSGCLLRGGWYCALLFAVTLMAGKTTATAHNLVASGDGTIKNLAIVKHILVAPQDTSLRIDWEQAPETQNDGIYGSVVVMTSECSSTGSDVEGHRCE